MVFKDTGKAPVEQEEKNLKVKGHMCMPTKTLRITTRKNTLPSEIVQQITFISIKPGVENGGPWTPVSPFLKPHKVK
uniref:Uncharacterized protein n=1 Tax=Leptobrachium leishanense TaxID=445787 RepID=A0A8C5PWA4_9ANUR